MKKGLFVAIIVAIIIAFFALGGHQWLTLENLKSSQADFQQLFSESPWLTAGTFFLIYVAVTALSLPGAAVMTLASGALFGLGKGLILVSFASSLGALLAFLVARYLLAQWVQERFGSRMSAFNKGIEKDGAFYLFTLRLVPIFPFFLINLLMGLTPLRAWTFYWVSQLGMLAGTAAYVNAGTQLATIESLSGILSLNILLSFALLGVFPLIAKRFIGIIQKQRVYQKWQKPSQFDRNMIVIGAGAGGLVSAYIAAAVKAKVTLIEGHKMGGDCLNFGCVPSKALIKSAKVAKAIKQANAYGLKTGTPSFEFKALMQRILNVIKAIEPHDSVERYTGLGVEVIQGYAILKDPWTVEIQLAEGKTQRLTAQNIVLATGASPFVPPIPGLEDTGYVTSDTLWETFAEREEAPKQLTILGGGPIGCELAQSFARLGIEVTQVEAGTKILPREDQEVSDLMTDILKQDGVNLLVDHKAVRAESEAGKKYLIVEYQGTEKRIEFDDLLLAVGRKPRLEGYGLDTLGIETNRTITTNEYLETLYPNIFAVGDVVGPYQFTHAAAHQAWFAAVNALFGRFKKFKADYRALPWTTFVDPEVARVGLNEFEAKEQGIAYEISKYPLDDLDRAIAESETEGFVKVLTVPGKDEILGVTIVGSHAGDWISEFVFAMNYRMGLNKVLGTVHAYPTWAEANKYASGVWKKAHAPEKVLKWLEKYHAKSLNKSG
jgi:pyruvate/2-oxoglutarate dehydrogenase complex dihydrolipoamide dehydrogenase (E3) component/uncharacterized membrane protein YdjX (TVP38/TMEM64 family)